MTPKLGYKTFYVKNKLKTQNLIWIISLIIVFSLFLIYCFVFPNNAGILGIEINKFFTKFLGINKFFVPLLFLYWIWYILKSKKHNFKYDLVLIVLFFVVLSGFIKVILLLINIKEANLLAGKLGNLTFNIFDRIFGKIFGSIVIFLLLLYLVTLLFEVSLYDILYHIYVNIITDIQNWGKELKTKTSNESLNGNSRYIKQRTPKLQQSTTTTTEIIKDVVKTSQILQPSISEELRKKDIQKPKQQKIEVSPQEPKNISSIEKKEYILSLKNYLQTERIYEILNKKEFLGEVYKKIGDLYQHQQQYARAIVFYDKALEQPNLGTKFRISILEKKAFCHKILQE
ncbi:MAG: DNA translocase FtsK 4TM domain-containing protein, partial [Candidatus Anstonellales archaeon]